MRYLFPVMMMATMAVVGCGANDGTTSDNEFTPTNPDIHLNPQSPDDAGWSVEDASIDVAINPQEDSGSCHKHHHCNGHDKCSGSDIN